MKIVYVDMDDVLCYFLTAFQTAVEKEPKISFPQSQYGFFANLKPLKGAIDAMNWLYQSTQFKPYILTAPSIENPMSYTEKRVWVEQYLGMDFVERLIISRDKFLLRGDFLVDDLAVGRGQEGFQGELVQFGSDRYPNWDSVIEYLRQNK